MKKITHKELASLLASKPGAMPIGIVSRTDSDARKTGNPYGKVYKLAKGAVWTGTKYQDGVNTEAVRQGLAPTFEAGPLPDWQEWVTPNKVIRNKKTGGLMLRTQSQPNQRKMHSFRVTGYETESGVPVPVDAIKPFLPVPSSSRKQEAIGMVGVEKQTAPRNYNFSSLLVVRIRGVRYQVISG
jgi:hypothetical protein